MEVYTRELYREIGKLDSGHEFIGFGSREFMSRDRSWFPGRVVDSGISGENRVIWALGELFAVRRAAKKLEVDLIHSPATLGPWRPGVRSVLTIHDLHYFKNPELMNVPMYNRPVQWMEKIASAHASRILATADVIADEITQTLRVPRDKIDVVPLAGLRPVSPGTVEPRKPRQLFTGGVRRRHKNFEGLLKAMTLIPEDRRPRLIITGSHGDDPLRPLVSDMGLSPWVDLKGWIEQDELDALFSESTAYIMPSFVDGFSLPPLEAMGAGCPTLLSGNEMLREIGGSAAVYFDPHDPQSIANAIDRTLADPELLTRLSRDGVARAAEFSWAKVALGTLASLDKALSG